MVDGVGSQGLVAAGIFAGFAEEGQADRRKHEYGEESISSNGFTEPCRQCAESEQDVLLVAKALFTGEATSVERDGLLRLVRHRGSETPSGLHALGL